MERGPSSSSTPAPPQPPRPPPHLRIRVLSLQKRSRDLCVQLEASTNLPAYRRSHYPPFTRTLRELALFALSLSVHVPTHILAALPLPTPGLLATIGNDASVHPTSLPEGRLLCFHLSRWLQRLVAEPAHRDHAETRNFVEADYSYHPLEPMEDGGAMPLVAKRWHALMAQQAHDRAAAAGGGMTIDVGVGLGLPSGVVGTTVGGGGTTSNGSSSSGGSSFFGISLGGGKSSSSSTGTGGKGLSLSRNVHDDDEDLVSARMEVTRLELQFSTAAQKGQNCVAARTSRLSTSTAALCNSLHTWAGVEATRPLCAGAGLPSHLETLAKALAGPLDAVTRSSCQTEGLTLLYQLAYQGKNARAAKEALLARNALVEEHYEASKRALVKKRDVESLKIKMGSQAAHHGSGSSNSHLITRDRIEVAIDDFADSARYAAHLRQLLGDLSGQMHESLRAHSRSAHADVKQSLQEHARGMVRSLRREMDVLRRVRGELRGEKVEKAGKGGVLPGDEEGEGEEADEALVGHPSSSVAGSSPPPSSTPAPATVSSNRDFSRGAPAPQSEEQHAQQESFADTPAPRRSTESPYTSPRHSIEQQRPPTSFAAGQPRPLSPSPPSPATQQRPTSPPAPTATQSMFLPQPSSQDEQPSGFSAHQGGQGGLNTSRFSGGRPNPFLNSGAGMSNSVSALPQSERRADADSTPPPISTFGTTPRSGPPGRGGGAAGRGGRGRISASEAARSLGGRF
ncbi:hypothetical protein BDZ90DRAFT_233111 [Jaminaea rosea]|uniref:Sorting nexin/Vps5-like C-terminal domain-containing protein n=1 Tax=Jaminaea rosea TaxID=1569628 RepID=A0A316UTQ8_9BASI|nr:hypothetical protein BDZ90DRAFT_233111 [Jaminaea rosea]PWN26475.1 hypothetical protein BDZ90DRAFT_233111 [Jaminaea rosea]